MSLFELIATLATAVAFFGYVNHRYVGLPDTVGITAMGLLMSLLVAVFGRHFPGITDRAATFAAYIDLPEVVFHGLLGVLLFAGSLHINFSDLARQRLPIFVLSTVGVVMSTGIVGCLTHWLLAAIGIDIRLSHCLLFGALISPTDPIAVLGVLKTAGAPKSLETNFSGESLFNDGTGVVVYLVLLGIVTGSAEPTFSAVSLLLAKEVIGAAVLGLAVGYGALYLLKGVASYPVEILITLALSTGGYALAERAHVSAPLAVVVMGLVIGNHGRGGQTSPAARDHLIAFWELLDEVLNLILFGLIGINLLALADSDVPWLVGMAIVPVVLFARFTSVGLPVLAMRRWLTPTPHAIKLLTWGGLRGGISVALALSMPGFAGKELFVTATYAVVLFSLLVQAPTLGRLLRRLEVFEP